VYRILLYPEGWAGVPGYYLKDGLVYRILLYPEGWAGVPGYYYYILKNGLVYQGTIIPCEAYIHSQCSYCAEDQ
jgi:hypothetical protein